MLANYLKIGFRTLLKFKGYAIINLAGLALGLSTAILIMIYVMDELSFDKFHTKADRIYRVGTDMTDIRTGALNGSIEGNAWPVGVLLKKDYPEIESVVYIKTGSNLPVVQEGRRFEEKIFYASEDFFHIFDFPLTQGQSALALEGPNKIVISEAMEKKYFGAEKALGKTLTFADTLSFMVTGVMRNVPAQSHMQFDILISFDTYKILNKDFSYDDGWGNLNIRNYVLLKEGVDQQAFLAKSRNLYMDYVKDDMKKFGMYMYVDLEPFSEVYLKTKKGNGMGPVGSIERVYMVSGIALFVVLLACINFINLSTARSSYRAKEVGLRKVVGSTRYGLIRQFLSESFLITMTSFILALLLSTLLLPFFNELMGKAYTMTSFGTPVLLFGFTLLIVIVSFLSGYYPALVISSLKPSEVLKGKLLSNSRGIQLRRVLVVFQFVISAVLIIGTLVVKDQLDYMKNKELGFFGDQIIVLNISKVPADAIARSGSLKNDLRELASVQEVTFTNAVPGKPGWVGQWAHAAEKSADETISTEYMTIDEDFIKTLGLTLIAGRNFDPGRPGEMEDGLIINEKTAEKMGWESPEAAIGKKIESPSSHPAGTVIGVVKNYHEFGLQREIFPMAMDYKPQFSRYYAIRFNASETTNLIQSLSVIWNKHYEGVPFDYFFLDENFERQYQSEQRLGLVFMVFSSMTILIAVIGLVGLVSFMVTARTKEIGVRKVFGANVLSISRLLSNEFLVMVAVANVIASPIAWYLANEWLRNFAYRTQVRPDLFFWTFLIALSVTLVTVSFQTIRAAMSDPVKALRYE